MFSEWFSSRHNYRRSTVGSHTFTVSGMERPASSHHRCAITHGR